MPVFILSHLLIWVVKARIDRHSPGHVENLSASSATLFTLNFFGQGLLNVPAYIIGTAFYVFREIIGKPNGSESRTVMCMAVLHFV